MATITDLEKFISDKWSEYCSGDPTRLAPFKIKIPFQDWEAKFFMRGIALKFFTVVALCDCLVREGKSKLPECHLHAWTLGDTTCKNFFYPRGPGNGREAVTQFAAITQLIEEYGYPAGNVLPESQGGERAIHRFALDGLVFDGLRPPKNQRGPVLIAMEAKKVKESVDSLVANIRSCVRRGEHRIDVHDNSEQEQDGHKKYLGIVAWRPAYFWVVSPTKRLAYSVRQAARTGFSLKDVDDIPKFTLRPARPVRIKKRIGTPI